MKQIQFILCFLFSCTALHSQPVTSVRINTDAVFSAPGFKIEKIIPLETSPEALVAYPVPALAVNKSYYIISDREKILLFDKKDGKVRHIYNIKGRGPGESLSLNNIYPDDSLLYIGNPFSKSIITYNYRGEFLQTYFNQPYMGSFMIKADTLLADTGQRSDSQGYMIASVQWKNGKVNGRYLKQQPSPPFSEGGYPYFQENKGIIYYLPCFRDTVYKVSGRKGALPFLAYDFGKGSRPSEDELKKMNAAGNPLESMNYFRENGMAYSVKPFFTGDWLVIHFYRGEQPYGFFYNIRTKKQYLHPINEQMPFPLGESVRNTEGKYLITLVEAAKFNKLYKEAYEYNLADDDNPVIVMYSLIL